MKDVSRVLPADDAQELHRIRILFPLWLKALCALVLTLLPFIALLFWAGHLWQTSADFSEAVSRLLFEEMRWHGYGIQAYYLFVLGIGLVGACLGFLAFDHFFIEPVRSLLKWLNLARVGQFENVPVLAGLRRDEVGELGRALSASVAFLSETKAQNKNLMGEKSLFMTIAAHQLRTPLTGLLWSIDALLDPSTSAESKEKLMADIDGELKRMRLIVNHILASANVEGGKFGYVFEQIDIVPVIEKLIGEFKPVSDSHGVSILFTHESDLFPVYADAERITLALFDLISNAIDYTPRGGTITVSVAKGGGRLEIAIADTGIGISESEIPMLFTRFYRGERARHLRPDGSGLGLYLVKDVVSGHGSDITVTSKEGSGSRFAFFLGTQKPLG